MEKKSNTNTPYKDILIKYFQNKCSEYETEYLYKDYNLYLKLIDY